MFGTLPAMPPRTESRIASRLDALAARVAQASNHPQIQVGRPGLLGELRDGHPAGTPYVTVTVPTVAAAELAARRLDTIARLDGAAWSRGWRLLDGAVLAIDVYPGEVATNA
jgi:hypothetical protein